MPPLPTACAPRPDPPSRPAGLRQRVVLMVLVLCVAMQGLAMSVQRGGGRLHFHAPVAGWQTGDRHEAAHARTPARGDAADAGVPASREPLPLFRHQQDHHHPHSVVARHDHALGEPSVVAVVDGGRDASQTPAHLPRLHDLDGFPRRHAAAPTPGVREAWRVSAAPVIRSHIASPPDRPPCA